MPTRRARRALRSLPRRLMLELAVLLDCSYVFACFVSFSCYSCLLQTPTLHNLMLSFTINLH